MNKKTITKVAIMMLGAVGTCWAGCCTKTSDACQLKKADANSVETILKKLSQKTEKLKSYQGRIEYRFTQPILESQTLRKGMLYYQTTDEKTRLRINFQALKQDDEEEQKYIEHYIFDGVWLTHIDYQIKEVKRYQQAEANQPVDAFELASENFPIIGFSKTEDLKKQFRIKLVKRQKGEPENFVHLHLKVKPDSVYEDWPSIDFWIDEELGLPAKIIATSTEDDIYQIEFLNPKVDKKLEKEIFEFKIPEGFGKEIIPLKKSKQK